MIINVYMYQLIKHPQKKLLHLSKLLKIIAFVVLLRGSQFYREVVSL